MTNDSTNTYDVIIVGSGIVGATLACLLAKQGVRLALLDRRRPDLTLPEIGYAARISAISPASKHILEHAGAWQALPAERLCPYTDMHVWDQFGGGNIHFDSNRLRVPALGYLVENPAIQASLLEQLATYANVDCLLETTLTGLTPLSDGYQLNTETGAQLRCSLLVGADGGQSWVRKHADISIKENPYQHHALVTTVTCEKPHRRTARQCFTGDGPLAFLPMAEPHTCSIVWSCSEALTNAHLALNDDAFMRTLGSHFEHQLGAITSVAKRFSFPLTMRHARQYVKPHLALVGDAAHTLHPLAGQGVNLGLLDAACLAEQVLGLATVTSDAVPLGNWLQLRRYERARKTHNTAMLAGMRAFKFLFSNERPLALQLLRNTGLACCDHIPALKQQFMRHAMGLSGELPVFAQPL